MNFLGKKGENSRGQKRKKDRKEKSMIAKALEKGGLDQQNESLSWTCTAMLTYLYLCLMYIYVVFSFVILC